MKKKVITEAETRPFAIRAITADSEKVVLPQRYGTIAAANKAIETMIVKRKFIGDDSRLWYVKELRVLQVLNTRNLEVEAEHRP